MLSKYINYLLPRTHNYVQSPPVYLSMVYLSSSQSMAPGPEASASPGNLLELHIVRSTPDLLNQKHWRWSPVTCVLTRLQVILMRAQVWEPLVYFNFFLLSSSPPALIFLPPFSWFSILMSDLPTLMKKMNFGPISSKLFTIEGIFPSEETS